MTKSLKKANGRLAKKSPSLLLGLPKWERHRVDAL